MQKVWTSLRAKAALPALEAFVLKVYKTKDLVKACEGLDRPTVFVVLPDQRYSHTTVRLSGFDAALSRVKANADFIVIQIARFL